MLYIASDHRGFKLKERLKPSLNVDIIDMGPATLNPEDDYPDYVAPTMQKLQQEPDSKAILLCKNGVGVTILANKFTGIRAGLSWDVEHAKSQRAEDNTNVLTLPADFISFRKAKKIVQAWLATPFSNEARHQRRLQKIKTFEKQHS